LKIRDGATGTEIMAAMRNSQLQAMRQQNGEDAEDKVEIALLQRGLKLVEKVEVGFGITQDGRRYAKGKVSGDYRAVEPGTGRSVLIESKAKATKDRLSWGDFRKHQPVKLDEHMVAGGITEVAWTCMGPLRFIPWSEFRRVGFGPGKSVVWTGNTIEIYTPTRGQRATTQTKAATA
jgi:hypothetical protein